MRNEKNVVVLLEQAVEQVREADTVGAVQTAVRTSARRLARADGATIVLREGDQCFYADEDAIAPLWKGQRFRIDDCISGWAMTHGQTAIIPDITIDPRIPQRAYRPTFVHSMAMFPVGGPEPLAAIGVYWARKRHMTEQETARLTTLAETTGQRLRQLLPGR